MGSNPTRAAGAIGGLQQRPLSGGNPLGAVRDQEDEWEGFKDFGNTPGKLNNDCDLRIVSWNINSFPPFKNSAKFRAFKNQLLDYEYSIMALNELNRCWRLIPRQDTPFEMLGGIWETSHINTQYNTQDVTPKTNQPGGTAIISTNRAACSILKKGGDPTGLGRWSWTWFRGARGISTVVVSVYRPCNPSNDAGISPNATFRQHRAYFAAKNRACNPRQAILDDLK